MSVETELAQVTDRIRRQHGVAPFLKRLHATSQMHLMPMPGDMMNIVSASPDYSQPEPGSPPVWLQIAAGNDAAELVIYRSEADSNLYVFVPIQVG